MTGKAERTRRPGTSGSAYIVVIGVIGILLIIVITFFKTNTSRHYLTRFASNEKKAEALAEASIELVLRYVKDRMNDTTDPNIYQYFRYPAEITNGKMSDATGQNSPLNLAPYAANPLPSLDLTTPALAPIANMLAELGGPDRVTLGLKCEVLSAAAFTSKKPGYAVPGITIMPRPTNGETAAFLDDFDEYPANAGRVEDLIGTMGVKVNLPNFQAQDEELIKLRPSVGEDLAEDRFVRVTKVNDYTLNIRIKVKIPLVIDMDETKVVDINSVMKEYIDIGDEPVFSLEAIRRIMMPNTPDEDLHAITWQADILQESIRKGFDAVPGVLKGLIDKEAFSPSKAPKIVEKGGILRFTAEVAYRPQGQGGPLISRTLVADREYKVSDIQPPAPEYSFFVANSNLLFEQPSDKYPGEGAGIESPIDWNGGVATICIHNLPDGEYKSCTGMSGTGGDDPAADSLCQVPGQLRINSNGAMAINTFLGTSDEPTLTEFNALGMDEFAATKPRFNIYPTLQWTSRATSPDRTHEIDFPVLRNTDLCNPPLLRSGVKSMLTILSFCDAISAPTLLFGKGHFEYPLGLRAEAQLDSRYGNILINVQPYGQAGNPRDITKIEIYYKNLKADFGLQGKPAYTAPGDWSPGTWECMPPNLYSLLQYAKKATHFYENEDQFWDDLKIPVADGGRMAPDGSFDCTGVTYIIGDLSITDTLRVSGKGLLVVRDNISLSANVERADRAVFSLIARRGAILVDPPCTKIQASCFSNYALQNQAGNPLVIDGNLVTNEFRRDAAHSVEVFYNSAACRVSPLSVQRDVGKYDPERYIVTLGKRWARFEYAKRN
ncbi:MAG TPA: hypothetical protein PLP29_17565 [Candidatus Ozemobacteraceae bacterium]|nr:hypothetical protein [Candidatus Ozemobacteraceae bacterium]